MKIISENGRRKRKRSEKHEKHGWRRNIEIMANESVIARRNENK
jgi:hypothetical protein